jgi:hypothetical protein
VAHILNIPLELVSVKPSNNLTSPNGMVTGGSIASDACAYVRAELAYLFKGMTNCVDFVTVHNRFFTDRNKDKYNDF